MVFIAHLWTVGVNDCYFKCQCCFFWCDKQKKTISYPLLRNIVRLIICTHEPHGVQRKNPYTINSEGFEGKSKSWVLCGRLSLVCTHITFPSIRARQAHVSRQIIINEQQIEPLKRNNSLDSFSVEGKKMAILRKGLVGFSSDVFARVVFCGLVLFLFLYFDRDSGFWVVHSSWKRIGCGGNA